MNDSISSIIYNLVTIIWIFEEEGDQWTETEKREQQLVLLEKTAKIIENDLPRGLYGGDVATDVWVKETMRQVAAALREKKKMLLTPKSDTRDSFINGIATILNCIADGNWGEVERIEPPKVTRTQLRYSFSKFLKRLLRTLVIGAVPLVGLLVLQQTSFALQGATFASTIAILFIYEISVFTSVLDPSFGDRISNVKDIKDLVSSPEMKPKP